MRRLSVIVHLVNMNLNLYDIHFYRNIKAITNIVHENECHVQTWYQK